jgi:hypothetical protein
MSFFAESHLNQAKTNGKRIGVVMRKWILHWKAWWMRRQYLKVRLLNPKLTDHQAARETLEALLGHLSEVPFQHFHKDAVIGVELKVFYKTIDEYRQEMKALSGRLLNEQMIQTAWADQTEKEVAMDRFLTSKDGFYLDVVDAIHGFKHEALVLCALMQKSDQAKFGVHEHNRRMLLKFMANLRTVTVHLIDTSHSLSPQA